MKKYKIGYTDGVYDLFHTGHLNMIETAKSQCEHLIVGIHGDDVVEGYKHRRPIINASLPLLPMWTKPLSLVSATR